jgi:hypothetical protein
MLIEQKEAKEIKIRFHLPQLHCLLFNRLESGESFDFLVSDDFNEHSFAPLAVEFAVENLFPRPEIEFAFGDRDDDFAAHDLTFEMRVGVVFAGAIVSISRGWRVWRQLFQPLFVVVMESWFIVIDEHRSGDMHGIDQTKNFGYGALPNEIFDLWPDVDESASIRYFEPEMFS